MQVTRKNTSDTKTILTVQADEAYLKPIKDQVLAQLSSQVKVAGFREGKVPPNMVEKHADPQLLQSQFVDEAVNQLYVAAAQSENLRPVSRPNITLKKFVPFTTIEFEAEVEILGKVKLPDYKKVKKSKPTVKIAAADIDAVLDNLKTRVAESTEVKRAAQNGDKVWIDFKGVDSKSEPIKGADGKDYPLLLGSDTFIPGFEKNLIGVKPGGEVEFTLSFPKDYGVSALAGKKATFTVTLRKVEAVKEPKLDDAFAAKVGPFASLADLKSDIKKQLMAERATQAMQAYETELIQDIASKAKLDVPEVLVEEQAERLLQDLKQNLSYRGQTYQEFLQAEGKTEEVFKKEVLMPDAAMRVRIGLVLAEIANEEKLDVDADELDKKMQELKAQYTDAAMQQQLDSSEARRDIASRMLTEKTIKKLVAYAEA